MTLIYLLAKSPATKSKNSVSPLCERNIDFVFLLSNAEYTYMENKFWKKIYFASFIPLSIKWP